MGGRVETTGGQFCISLIFSDVAPPKDLSTSPKADRQTLRHSANFIDFVVTFLKSESKAS